MANLEEQKAILERENERLRSELAEQRRAWAEMAEREERLRMVFMGASEGILIADVESKRFTYANPAICRFLGYTEEELCQRSVLDIHPSQDLDRVLAEFMSLARGEKTRTLGIPCLRKDGTIVYADISAAAMVLGGKPCNVGFFTDVSERRQVEGALRISEGQYRATIDSMGDAIHVVDRDMRIVLVNQAFVEWNGELGLQTEMIGRTVFELFPFLPQHVRDEYQQVFASAEPLVSEEQIAVGDKTIVTEVRKIPVFEGDQVVRVVTVIRNITERKQAERALRESEERYRTLAEAAHDMIFVVDRDDRVSYVNWYGARSLGRRPEEMIGNPRASFFPGEAGARQYQNLRRVFDTGAPVYVENPIPLAGQEVWLGTRLVPIRSQEGRVTAVMGVSRNITEQRLLEERLRRAQRMEAIGHLAGGIAHDFNNQLTGIMGFSEVLANRLEDPRLRGYADNILRASQRAADLTRDLLAFARKGRYLSVTVDVHRLIEETLGLLERSLDKRIVIQRLLKAHPATVTGDPTQLQNALLNMAINARDAMPGGGQLIFETETVQVDGRFVGGYPVELDPGRYVRISLADTGCGMSRETMEHIFEPFFTTKEVGRGTGLGLASVYGTVKSHHGAITVRSEVGKGSRFDLFLPATEEPHEAPIDARSAHSRTEARILVVDDEDIVRRFVTEMLRSLGHHVTACKDGTEAIAQYGQEWQRIDLVILDMAMPGMSGRDTFLAMRSVNPNVRVLLMSGFSMDSMAESVLAEGAIGFIQKPFEMKELSRKLSEALQDT